MIAFLAGGAIFLAVSEQLGPFATMVLALALLVAVLVTEAWRAAGDTARSIVDRDTAYQRWAAWGLPDAAATLERLVERG